MMNARKIHRLLVGVVFLLTSCLIFFNEYLVYYVYRFSWSSIHCKTANCTRLLLVADPQLLGNTFNEQFYTKLARFDSDIFLRRTFEQALRFTNPHVLCFLGDLLDEGSVATSEDFQGYVERFKSIYREENFIPHIHIAGDNDIGGEGGEPVLNSNVQRFEDSFTRTDIITYNNTIRFFRINQMTNNISDEDHANNNQYLRIGLSHMPLLVGRGSLVRTTLKQLDPHVIFSGHWHESRISLYPSARSLKHQQMNSERHYDLKALKRDQHSYLEITVPTASYRMGTRNMGLGYAVIENFNLIYVVLWLPNRFAALLMYIYWLLLVSSIFLLLRILTRCTCRASKAAKHIFYSHL